MNIIKLTWFFLRKKKKPTVSMLETFVSQKKVKLSDIDMNFHINNANYLKIMEDCRWEQSLHSGFLDFAFQNKINFILAGAEISYLREIKLFEKYQVKTTYLGGDQKYVYVEQKFFKKEALCTHAIIKVALVGRKGIVKPAELSELLNIELPKAPEFLEKWKAFSLAKKEN